MFRYNPVEFYKNANKIFSPVRAICLCSWKLIHSIHRIGCVTSLWTWGRIDINNLILGFHVEYVLSTWNFCQWVCQMISAVSAAPGGVTVGFFMWQHRWVIQSNSSEGTKSFFFLCLNWWIRYFQYFLQQVKLLCWHCVKSCQLSTQML